MKQNKRLIVLQIKSKIIILFWNFVICCALLIPQKIFSKNIPGNFEVFYGFSDKLNTSSLVRAYQTVFKSPPWNEIWSQQDIVSKLKRETGFSQSVTVLMHNNSKSVCGFSWGRILYTYNLENELESALGVKPIGLQEKIEKLGIKKLFYFYEIAILPEARGGIDPIKFLVYSGLKLSCKKGVLQSLFWSTPKSNIVNLALLFGYQPIFECKDMHGHDIVFFINRDHTYFLKVMELVNGKIISKLMGSIKILFNI